MIGLDLTPVGALADFLNDRNGTGEAEMAMQMLKLQEEAGEAAATWIGYRGQNPRKGVTHALDDVYSELADVAISALVGISRLGGSPRHELEKKLEIMRERYRHVGG